MSSKWDLRPGMMLIVAGVVVIGMPLERLATNGAADLTRVQFALLNGVAGLGLSAWGWSRLRQAKADCPNSTWRDFLHDDLLLLSVGCVILTTAVVIPAETRDALMRSLAQVAEAMNMWRVGP